MTEVINAYRSFPRLAPRHALLTGRARDRDRGPECGGSIGAAGEVRVSGSDDHEADGPYNGPYNGLPGVYMQEGSPMTSAPANEMLGSPYSWVAPLPMVDNSTAPTGWIDEEHANVAPGQIPF